MNGLQSCTTLILLAAALMPLVSCDVQKPQTQFVLSDNQANASITVPDLLVQARNINPEQLVLQVVIGDRDPQEVAPDIDGNYTLSTTLAENTNTVVSLTWLYRSGDTEAVLAKASKRLQLGSDFPPPLIFRNDDYTTASFDDDNDGYSNFDELNQGSLLNDATDPPAPPVMVDFIITVQLPQLLLEAPDMARSQIDAKVTVNDGIELTLSKDGDQWAGQTTVAENSNVTVLVELYDTAERRILIAQETVSGNAGSRYSLVIDDAVYDDLLFLNDDNDAFSNAQEIVLGSNPRDRSDPDGDGDAIIDEDDNCPFQQNPEQDDSDGDLIGDVCDDFNNIDGDEDGVNNDDDNCPDIANPEQDDADNDGMGTACDSTPDGDTPPEMPDHDSSEEAVDEGTVDEGTVDEGTVDEGTVDEGTVDEGTVDEGTVDEGTVDEGATDEGATDEGATDEGATDEGATDEGATDEGTVDEETTDEGTTDEGTTDEANVDTEAES